MSPAIARKPLARAPRREAAASRVARGAVKGATGTVAAARAIVRALKARRRVSLAEEAKIREPEKLIEKFREEHPNYGELLIRDEKLAKAHMQISKLSYPEKKAFVSLLIKYKEQLFENPDSLYLFLKGPKTKIALLVDIINQYSLFGHSLFDLISDVLYISKYGLRR